jgi:hypothetical protein
VQAWFSMSAATRMALSAGAHGADSGLAVAVQRLRTCSPLLGERCGSMPRPLRTSGRAPRPSGTTAATSSLSSSHAKSSNVVFSASAPGTGSATMRSGRALYSRSGARGGSHGAPAERSVSAKRPPRRLQRTKLKTIPSGTPCGAGALAVSDANTPEGRGLQHCNPCLARPGRCQ